MVSYSDIIFEEDCKMILVGESSVGKTCIINKYMFSKFLPDPTSTVGSSYLRKTLYFEKTKINLDIWDTAGQEIYHGLTKIFMKQAKIAILVYDITNYESFEQLKKYWYDQIIECNGKNVILGIAGNKSDLFDKEKVPNEEVLDFSKKINAIFKETSAKSNIGIDELIDELSKKYYETFINEKMKNMTKEEKENYKKLKEKKENERISIKSNAQHTKVKCCLKK
jgi:small GTP-binding protein